MSNRQAVFAALRTIIEKGSEEDRGRLSEVLEDYAYKYSRSYRDMEQHPFLGDLLDMLEEATDARISRNSVGLPERPLWSSPPLPAPQTEPQTAPQPTLVIGPNTTVGDENFAPASGLNHSAARLLLWFKSWDEAVQFSASLQSQERRS